MIYCTLADMERNFGKLRVIQLTDTDQLGVVGMEALNSAIASANAEIDSHLRVRHVLPLEKIDLHLSNIACDVTAFYLTKMGALLTEEIKTGYSAASKWLVAVRDGKAKISGDGELEQGTTDNQAFFGASLASVANRSALL
jgi:phage gp36-like protein